MHPFWFNGSLSFNVLCLHVAENISLTYAKFFLLIVLFDSLLVSCDDFVHYPKLPKGAYFSFSDFLPREILDKRRGF
jgi:hypothetical protein